MAVQTAKKVRKSLFEDEQKKPVGDLNSLIEHVKQQPYVYAGAAAFILVCFVAGIGYRAYSEGAAVDVQTGLVRALEDKTDPAAQLAIVEPLAEDARGEAGAAALYIAGELAFQAGETDKAAAAYTKLRDEYSGYEFMPDAIEGLGFIAEQKGDYEGALAYYREITSKYPESFAARRQPFNIAKALEKQGNLADAVAAYREQATVFAGSNVARHAQDALARLEQAHPDLFPQTPTDPALPNIEFAPGATDAEAPAVVPDEANAEMAAPSLSLGAPQLQLSPSATPESGEVLPSEIPSQELSLTPPAGDEPAAAEPTPADS